MHNLALAMHRAGHFVTGSDDEIFEPSRSRLAASGLLPDLQGWHPERLHEHIDVVVLGMHAHADNSELKRAQELGLHICSYPEFLFEQTKAKKRVVIGGSHGKTTITSMVMHAMQGASVHFDYMVGALIEGFSNSVHLDHNNTVAVIEGDEYLASALDRRPKFHLYHPHIALISGVDWDHMNVFPTYDAYRAQFSTFIDLIEQGGTLVYCGEDPEVKALVEGHSRYADGSLHCRPYVTPEHRIAGGHTSLLTSQGEVKLSVFGRHNLQNLEGARMICEELGVSREEFYAIISTFKGASRRLEVIHEEGEYRVYRDFAHAPSKLRATALAVREQHPGHRLIACMELHTYSSLNKAFLDQYAGCIDLPDVALVYYSPEVVERKRLAAIQPEEIKAAFKRDDLHVATTNEEVQAFIDQHIGEYTVLLLMSSGNWGGGVRHVRS